ncbi:MAG: FkbM family methyltransferase [Opitutales bacterium]|nr:FkbM family methyltransferase [Opitutales bacterium]
MKKSISRIVRGQLGKIGIGLYDTKRYRTALLDDEYVIEKKEFPVRVYSHYMNELLAKHSVANVLDVGANVGAFIWTLRQFVGFTGRIHSFEPNLEIFKHLDQKAKKDGNAFAHAIPLGKKEGEELKINIMQSNVFSSFLTPNSYGESTFENQNKVVKTQICKIRTLNSVFPEIEDKLLKGNIFLKCDTQGFDHNVIQGADQILPKISLLQVELNFKPIYENSPSFENIYELCLSHGFALALMFPVNHTEDGALLEADGVFVNTRMTHTGSN